MNPVMFVCGNRENRSLPALGVGIELNASHYGEGGSGLI
jgi:hypothetical protein